MSDLHVKYLLMGGGVAGSEAARAIREIDAEGDVLLVGQEISRPYHRPPLSKEFLRGEQGRDALFAMPAEWFIDNRVQLRTGRRISHLDTTRGAVTLDNGEGVSFDQLLIATGGSAAMLETPGADLPNLFYLRTLEDAEHLQHAMFKARKEGQPHDKGRGRATIIGGGLLGVELAASLTQAGLHVDLAVSKGHPWSRFAGEATGRCVARFLENHGVTVHNADRAARLEGDGRVQRVILTSGKSIACDFAVAAAGIQIHKEILRGTPITAEKAILVDAGCRTNIREIFAAGDCAAVFDPLFGKHRMMHHWESAMQTGRIAGTNMAGGNARFESDSYFDSQVFELKIGVWGEARVVDRRIIRGTPSAESPRFVEIGVDAGGRIAQVIAVGDLAQKELLGRLVRERVATEGKEEQLRDPNLPLEEILK
ncbi:MAG TPA: FAD-dependent oxidoreductase [Tepidisphaeraceae bacterium]|jgi:3-phenylpropionate/trans-cinnamate dioxygenase ferredoxin reductase subunit|nr:FAD-dependent oxidoreductase [Tepidisphaeraceae bacterium]